MLPQIVIAVVFGAILVSLGFALASLVRSGNTKDRHRLAKALTVRVALSVGLFILLFVLFALGVIRPHGLQG